MGKFVGRAHAFRRRHDSWLGTGPDGRARARPPDNNSSNSYLLDIFYHNKHVKCAGANKQREIEKKTSMTNMGKKATSHSQGREQQSGREGDNNKKQQHKN